ncbi:MAG TPA: hypothetical protein VF941_24800 [Clostridia bacterium]
MKISEAKQCIKELYLCTESVSALVGERGVGKTSTYKQCAEELSIGYLSLYAAALEGTDFMGLPERDNEKGITRYLAPQFLPTSDAVKAGLFPQRGILVFEEFNRVPKDTVSVLYPILLERKINGHVIAPGWKIGVTMIPSESDNSLNNTDDAMMDRIVPFELTPDLDEYIDFSIKNGPNEDVLLFLQMWPDMLLVSRKQDEAGGFSKAPTPRSWTKVQEIMNRIKLSGKLLEELVSGVLGTEAASVFFSFIKEQDFKIPQTEKLLTNFDEVKPNIDEIIKKNRMDVLNIIIKKAVLMFDVNGIHLGNLDAFLDFIPEEHAISFFKLLASQRSEDFEEAAWRLIVFNKLSDEIIGTIKQ